MKVTIEFTTDDDLELLESVFKARAAEAALATGGTARTPPPAAPAPEAAIVPPAPPAPTPAAAVVPPPPAPFSPTLAAPALDSAGMPWDGRIHSSSKAFLADGTWRQRRNTDPAVVAAVTAELRAAMAAPAAPAVAFEEKHIPVPPDVVSPADAFFTPPTLAVPVAPAPAAVAPPPPPADTPMSFPAFMKAITAARTPPATVLAACTAVGVPNIPALMSRPDLIPQVAATLGVS